MSRVWKAVLALGAATVLCLAGGSSAASWVATAPSAPATFTTGQLRLEPVAASATWTSEGTALTGTYRAVPGGTLTYTQQFALTAEGDGLVLDVSVDPGAITAGSFVVDTISLTGDGVTAHGSGWRAHRSATLTLTMTLVWPKGGVDDATQGIQIAVAAGELLVVQKEQA